MKCEVNIGKYTSVVEKLIRYDKTYTNFDNVAEFILKGGLTDEAKKLSLHNIAHIYKELVSLDPSTYTLGKADVIISNVTMFDDTPAYIAAAKKLFGIKDITVNNIVKDLRVKQNLNIQDVIKAAQDAIKVLQSLKYTSEEHKKDTYKKAHNALSKVIYNATINDTGQYREALISALNKPFSGLLFNTSYVPLSSVKTDAQLDRQIVYLTSGKVHEGFAKEGDIYIISDDGSLQRVDKSEVTQIKDGNYTSEFFSNAQGQQKIHESTFTSSFTIVSVDPGKQRDVMDALNTMADIHNGISIKAVKIDPAMSDRVQRIQASKPELSKRTLETFETKAQQQLLQENNTTVMSVARPTAEEHQVVLIGTIKATGDTFYMYTFDNYAFISSDNTTTSVDFSNPVHKEKVKRLAVKTTSAGETSITDADLKNAELTYKRYQDLKQEIIDNDLDDVTNLFLNTFEITQRRSDVQVPLTDSLEVDKTLSVPVRVLKDGIETDYNLPVYFTKTYNKATGKIEYTYQNSLEQGAVIVYTKEDGTKVNLPEAIYIERILKATDDVLNTMFDVENEQIVSYQKQGLKPKYQTSNFILTFDENKNITKYRVVKPVKPFMESENFAHFVLSLNEILQANDKPSAVKNFDKNQYTFALRKGLAINFAFSKNGKLQIEIRTPYNSPSPYKNLITTENKNEFNFVIGDQFLRVLAANMVSTSNKLFSDVLSAYPSINDISTSADKVSAIYKLGLMDNPNPAVTKYISFINDKVNDFGLILKKQVLDKLVLKTQGTPFIEQFKKDFDIKSNGNYDEFMFDTSTDKLIPRIQFAPGNVKARREFNNTHKNLNVLNQQVQSFNISIKDTSSTITSPDARIEATTYPVKQEVEVPQVPTPPSTDILNEDDLMAFSIGTPQTVDLKHIQEQRDWLAENLPQFSISTELQDVVDLATIDGTVLGIYKDAVIYLNKNLSGKGTIYHEAFHGVFRNMLNNNTREALLNEVKNTTSYKSRFTETSLKDFATKRNIPYVKENIENLVAEEILAERFQNYMVKNKESKSIFKKFFEALQKILKFFVSKQSDIDVLFSDIRKGAYSTRVLQGFKTDSVAFELIPGLKAYNTTPTGQTVLRSTQLDSVTQNSLVNMIVGNLEYSNTTLSFDKMFDNAVDYVLNNVYDISQLIRQNPDKEKEIIEKYAPIYSQYRFVLGGRLMGISVKDINNTSDENLNNSFVTNIISLSDGTKIDNTYGNYSKELLKKAVKEKYDLLSIVKLEDGDEEIDVKEQTDEQNKEVDNDKDVDDETKENSDFEKSFNEFNRMDSYVSQLRRFLSSIRQDKTDKDLNITVPNMVDGEALFPTLLKITSNKPVDRIIPSLKTVAKQLTQDGFTEYGEQLQAVYDKIIDTTSVVDGKPTRNVHLYNMIIDVLHGVEMDYVLFNINTPKPLTEEELQYATIEDLEKTTTFTLKDRVVETDINKKKEGWLTSIINTFNKKASTEQYQTAIDTITRISKKIYTSTEPILETENSADVELELLSNDLTNALHTIGFNIPNSLIKLSLLAIENKNLELSERTLEDLFSTKSENLDLYNDNITFVNQNQYLEKEFFRDLTTILSQTMVHNVPNPKFLEFIDENNEDVGRFMAILKNGATYALKYDPTEIPSVVKNAEGKSIYRYTKYTPLAMMIQNFKEKGLLSSLQDDEYFKDFLSSYMLDNPFFSDLLQNKDTQQAKEAALYISNMRYALFGGVQQRVGETYKEGATFKNIDERSLYILNILSFLSRTTVVNSETSLNTYMRSYHQIESTSTNFLISAAYKQFTGNIDGETEYEKKGFLVNETGHLLIVDTLKDILKQEHNRISREWSRRTELKTDFENKTKNNIILKYNGEYNKDGSVNTDKGRAYTINSLDTFVKQFPDIADLVISNAKEGKAFEELNMDDVLDALNDYAISEVSNHINKMYKLGVIVKTEDGATYSELLPTSIRQDNSRTNISTYYKDRNDNGLLNLISDNFFNYWHSALLTNQLFDGDIAMNVKNSQDYVKRNKKHAASGANAKTGKHSVAYIDTISGYVNRTYPYYGPYYSEREILDDVQLSPELKSQFVEEFKAGISFYDTFDGQSISTLMHQMDMYNSVGRLDEKAKDLLIAKHYRTLTKDEIKYLKGLKIVNNAKKTITATRFQYHKQSEAYIDRNDVSYLIGKKEDVYPILHQLYSEIYQHRETKNYAEIQRVAKEIHKFYAPLPGRETMHDMLNSMEYFNIDQVMDTTASKNATRMPIKLTDKKDGYINLAFSSVGVENNGKYVQVETSGVKNKAKVSVQKKVLIAADLDQLLEVATIDAEKRGVPITEAEKTAIKNINQTLIEYQSSLTASSESRLLYLQKILRNSTDGNFDIAKVFKLIQESLEAQGAPENSVKLFDVENGTPRFSTSLPILRNTLEYYFFSQYSNHVTDEKASGFKSFHESNFGYNVVVDENNKVVPMALVKANPEKYKTYRTRPLSVTKEIKADGTTVYHTECIIPRPEEFDNPAFRKFFTKHLSEMFGVRIPTEDKRSMIALKVVDFMDGAKLNNIQVPQYIHILSGSDFDIDSLYGQMMAYYEDANHEYHVYGDYSKYNSKEDGEYVEYMHYMIKKSEFADLISKRADELLDEITETSSLNLFAETRDLLQMMKVEEPTAKMYSKYQAAIEVLSGLNIPFSKDTFKDTDYKKIVVPKYQNKNLKASLDILSNEAVFNRLYINQESTTEAFKKVLSNFGIDLSTITKKGNMFTLDSVIASKVENAMNKDGIGMTAVLNKFLAVASSYGLELLEPIWDITTPDGSQTLYNKYGGINKDGQRAIELIGNVLGMFADGAKEPIPAALQLNAVNASTALSMLGLGMDPNFAFALNFLPEVKKASNAVMEAMFAVSNDPNTSRKFFSNTLQQQLYEMEQVNPFITEELVKNGVYNEVGVLSLERCIVDFKPKHIDVERLKEGELTASEIGFTIIAKSTETVLSEDATRYLLVSQYQKQALQTSDLQNVAALTNVFKSLDPSFKKVDKMMETLKKLKSKNPYLFTEESTEKLFNETQFLSTAFDTLTDLDNQSSRMFLERSEAVKPFTELYSGYFKDDKQIGEYLTSFIGIQKYVQEFPGTRKSTNPDLQAIIGKDDNNLKQVFTADYWYSNTLYKDLIKYKEQFPDNKFLKLLTYDTTDSQKTVNGEVKPFRYIRTYNKSKISGKLLTEVIDDAAYLYEYNPELKLFIKELFYQELARSGMLFTYNSYLKYLPEELFKTVSDYIKTSVEEAQVGNVVSDLLPTNTIYSFFNNILLYSIKNGRPPQGTPLTLKEETKVNNIITGVTFDDKNGIKSVEPTFTINLQKTNDGVVNASQDDIWQKFVGSVIETNGIKIYSISKPFVEIKKKYYTVKLDENLKTSFDLSSKNKYIQVVYTEVPSYLNLDNTLAYHVFPKDELSQFGVVETPITEEPAYEEYSYEEEPIVEDNEYYMDEDIDTAADISSLGIIPTQEPSDIDKKLKDLVLTSDVIDYLYNNSSKRLSKEVYTQEVQKLVANLKAYLSPEDIVEKLKCL